VFGLLFSLCSSRFELGNRHRHLDAARPAVSRHVSLDVAAGGPRGGRSGGSGRGHGRTECAMDSNLPASDYLFGSRRAAQRRIRRTVHSYVNHSSAPSSCLRAPRDFRSGSRPSPRTLRGGRRSTGRAAVPLERSETLPGGITSPRTVTVDNLVIERRRANRKQSSGGRSSPR